MVSGCCLPLTAFQKMLDQGLVFVPAATAGVCTSLGLACRRGGGSCLMGPSLAGGRVGPGTSMLKESWVGGLWQD